MSAAEYVCRPGESVQEMVDRVADAALVERAKREPKMDLTAIRRLLGARAEREEWSLSVCLRSAQARVEIVDGCDAAGVWSVAITGDTSAAEQVAILGVQDSSAVRERWAAVAPQLRSVI